MIAHPVLDHDRSVVRPRVPSEDELLETAIDAYTYAYPLVLMELMRRVRTNVASPGGCRAPLNQFSHRIDFPDSRSREVIRPNADSLQSTLMFDVSHCPLVIGVPPADDRYFALSIMDLWTDVFASVGPRTTGADARVFALVGPAWDGALPYGMDPIRAPTAQGWIVGRVAVSGPNDVAAVRRFQQQITAVPLGSYGRNFTPQAASVDPSRDMSAPVRQLDRMSAGMFFSTFTRLMAANPPHANDFPILERMARLNLVPGHEFSIEAQPQGVRQALMNAPALFATSTRREFDSIAPTINGWRMVAAPIGTYGTAYLRRAAVARYGLGANVVEDALYPTTLVDTDGEPLDSGKRYTIRFARGQTPPARGLWSLTLYDDDGYLAENLIERHALGSQDPLEANGDGSTVIHLHRQTPARAHEHNWLPTPRRGGFSLTLRLYWPKAQALDGQWRPPGVERVVG